MEKVKLFCLPYAGGSAMNYMSWKRYLDKRIELRPIELAGRGKRIGQPLYSSVEEAVNDIYNNIREELDEAPYAVYGHSMGTILAYELIRTIMGRGNKAPVHMFFSGRFPPFIEGDKKDVHILSDEDFMDKVYQIGGTNKEILENKELLELFMPILRADYKLVETYNYRGEIHKLNCDISILNGKLDDYIEGKDMQAWRKCASKNCIFYEFDDGHFFINKYREEVVDIIIKTLLVL